MRHDEENYNDPGCIHMSEIVAYEDVQSHVHMGKDLNANFSTHLIKRIPSDIAPHQGWEWIIG